MKQFLSKANKKISNVKEDVQGNFCIFCGGYCDSSCTYRCNSVCASSSCYSGCMNACARQD